jgi:hypothetical protein
MGLFPQPILERMAPSVDAMLVEMEASEPVSLVAEIGGQE